MKDLKLKLEEVFENKFDIQIEKTNGITELIINDLLFINRVDEQFEVWNDTEDDLFYFIEEDDLINYIKSQLEEYKY
jgi:hypothetical protein